MLNRIFLVFVFMMPNPGFAFSDGSGWKIVAQLTSLLKLANEHLDQAKQNLDVQKRLEKMAVAKEIKKTTELADDLSDLLNEIDRSIDHFDYEPQQSIAEIRSELNTLVDRYQSVEGKQDTLEKLKGYARVLKSIENLSLLQTHHFNQIKKISEEGMNEEEAISQSAYSTSIATQLAIEQQLRNQQRTLQKEKNALTDASYLKNMGGVYNALGSSKGE